MIETFVDLTYRGLPLGRRIKLTSVRPSTAYLELPSPMPVGTTIGILTDDTVALDAQVVEVREQAAGGERVSGMVVRPKLVGETAEAWWKARVALPELPPREAPAVPAPPIVATTVMPKRGRPTTGGPSVGVPELLDDGRNTAVMDAVDPEQLQDEDKKTTAMDAVDLQALGLDPHSRVTAPMPTVAPSEDDEPDKPSSRKSKKKIKR